MVITIKIITTTIDYNTSNFVSLNDSDAEATLISSIENIQSEVQKTEGCCCHNYNNNNNKK